MQALNFDAQSAITDFHRELLIRPARLPKIASQFECAQTRAFGISRTFANRMISFMLCTTNARQCLWYLYFKDASSDFKYNVR